MGENFKILRVHLTPKTKMHHMVYLAKLISISRDMYEQHIKGYVRANFKQIRRGRPTSLNIYSRVVFCGHKIFFAMPGDN